MQLINKIFKFNILILTLLCFKSFAIEIDPVEIGKKYQEDLEINLSIIENLRKEYKNEEIKIKKDVRRKIKEKENVIKKNNEIQIIFNSETSNLKNEDANKIRNFINNKIDKKNSYFKITSYAKTDKTTDISRRLSLDSAINIRSILLKEGIPAKNLIVKSFGDAKNKENKVIIKFEKK